MALTDSEKRKRKLLEAKASIDPVIKEQLKDEVKAKAKARGRGRAKHYPDKPKKERKTHYKPQEREEIRALLVKHWGATFVDKAMLNLGSIKEVDEQIKALKHRMDREIEAQMLEAEKYSDQIDREYRKVGRPNAVFSWKECKLLCSIGCTQIEIAGFFGIHVDTLRRKVQEEFGLSFNEFYENQSQGIKISLRRAQIKKALQGDTTMLKFLGKNILGQKEQVDFSGEVKVNSWVDLVKTLESEAGGEIIDAELIENKTHE